MTLDLKKPVQTRDGRTVRILATDADIKGCNGTPFPIVGIINAGESYVGMWTSKGSFRPGFQYKTDLVNVPEIVELTRFVNVYRNDLHPTGYDIVTHDTEVSAKMFSGSDCVKTALPIQIRFEL